MARKYNTRCKFEVTKLFPTIQTISKKQDVSSQVLAYQTLKKTSLILDEVLISNYGVNSGTSLILKLTVLEKLSPVKLKNNIIEVLKHVFQYNGRELSTYLFHAAKPRIMYFT